MSDALARWAFEICPGHPIDLGIVRAVKILRDAGFDTFEACEGGDAHAYAQPTVRFEGPPGPEVAQHALTVLAGLPVRSIGLTWAYEELVHAGNVPQGVLHIAPFWEVTFRAKLT